MSKRGGKKKREKKSSLQNQTWVPLMNGRNDRSCANLGSQVSLLHVI